MKRLQPIMKGYEKGISPPPYNGKSPALTTEINLFGKKVRVLGIRRLTPTECSRLQTVPTWYKWECSDSQAYRMLGNGWTVEVIKHFFSFLPWAKKEEA